MSQSPSLEEARKAFEAWLEMDKPTVSITYQNPQIEACWLAWLAASAAKEAEVKRLREFLKSWFRILIGRVAQQ